MNIKNLPFQISHFWIYSFINVWIEILEHVEDKNDKFARENDFIFNFITVYPYALNILINYVNIKKIVNNVYDLFNKFNDSIVNSIEGNEVRVNLVKISII